MVLPRDRYGRVIAETPQNIGFLAFDTDRKTQEKTYGIATFDRFGFEFCSLEVNGMQTVINSRTQATENGDPIWKWYDKIDPIFGLRGVGGV